jgi:hypothetical protein
MAPEEKYSVKEVEIKIGKELTKEEIKNIVDEEYNKQGGE